MMSYMKKLLLGLSGFALAIGMAQAQNFPAKPVKVVIPYGAGGDTDILMRRIQPMFAERLGQQLVVENRPGAGGVVGFPAISGATPDGYTFGLISSFFTQFPYLVKVFPADWNRQITPITMSHRSYLVFSGSPQHPAKTFADLIAYARANPGKVNLGEIGVAMEVEQFKQMSNATFSGIPYKTAPEKWAAVANNDTHISIDGINPSLRALWDAGKVKLLAVASPSRNPAYPNVPTVAETVPGYEGGYWVGLVAPAGTPRPAIDALNRTLVAILRTPEMLKYFQESNFVPSAGTPEELGRAIEADGEKWGRVARAAKIEPK